MAGPLESQPALKGLAASQFWALMSGRRESGERKSRRRLCVSNGCMVWDTAGVGGGDDHEG